MSPSGRESQNVFPQETMVGSVREIRFQDSQITGVQAVQGTVMRIQVIKYSGALSAGHWWERRGEFQRQRKKKITKTSNSLFMLPPPSALHPSRHCAEGFSNYIFRRLRVTCFSSHQHSALWTGAKGQWAGRDLREVGFPQRSLCEADDGEGRE